MQKYSSLLIILLLFACAPEKPKAPADTLTRDQMSMILADMHLADAIISMKSGSLDSVRQAGVDMREFIYLQHNTNHQQFTQSFEFYKQNPVMMDSIYADVITRLSSKETQYRGK